MFVGPRCFAINVAVLHWFFDSHFFLSYHQLVWLLCILSCIFFRKLYVFLWSTTGLSLSAIFFCLLLSPNCIVMFSSVDT